MSGISIGRLRGGYCVYWTDETGKRRRYQLAARSRTEAEAEGRDRYLKETVPVGRLTVTQIWNAYIEHLGTKPTAKTMTYTGRAVVPMNRMARAALESAFHARLTDYVVEWGGKRVKSIRKGYSAALERAELSGVNIHQIRHTIAVRKLSQGIPLEKVSQYLGHSNTAITYKTYARFLPDHMADAAEILNFDAPRRAGR